MPITEDNYSESAITAPAPSAAAIVPSDTVNLESRSRGIYIGAAGDISAQMAGEGGAVLFTGLVAGSILPIRVIRVNVTSTTASNLVALY